VFTHRHEKGDKMSIRTVSAALLAAAALITPTAASARTEIRVVGSSTVYPFVTAAVEQFKRANPRVATPVVESTGTGGGIKLFCGGVGASHPDIANASRRIKASELKACAANGVTQITEIQIGLDGLAIAASKKTAAMPLTLRDVYLALAKTPYGKPNKSKTWKDVNAKLPALPIRVYGPPPTSGTRDSFAELFLTPPCEANPSMAALKKSDEPKFKSICTGIREDGAYIEAGENDNLIVQKLEANPGTLGVFGYSYLEENIASLHGMPINGVLPNYETISTFKFPGARPLFIYVKNQHAKAVPSLRALVAELTKETTWGPQGYLARRGLIASPTGVRTATATAAKALTPLDFKTVK